MSKAQSPKQQAPWTAPTERRGNGALPREQKRRRASLAAAVPMAPVATNINNINDIRDIKPPVMIPSGWEWLWWTLGALAVLAILYFAWRFWQKRRLQIPEEPLVPAHVRAKQKLEEALALISQPKEFCILVSDTIRFYLEERFDFRAPERTTEEFLHELQSTDLLAAEQKEKLGEFLESCDLVKFAKYEPGEPELLELHSSAVRLVDETEPGEISNSGLQISNDGPPMPLETTEQGQIVNRKS